jgi:hypothetical protein
LHRLNDKIKRIEADRDDEKGRLRGTVFVGCVVAEVVEDGDDVEDVEIPKTSREDPRVERHDGRE